MDRPERLTQGFVNTLKLPGRYGDGRGGHGLSLLVRETSSGRLSKNWQQRVRLPDGKKSNVGLGSADLTVKGLRPALTLKDARQAASTNVLRVRASALKLTGLDRLLNVVESRAVGSPPFAELVEEHFEIKRQTWKNGKGEREHRSMMGTYVLPVLGDKPVAQIDSPALIDLLKPIWHEKAPTAKKLATFMSGVLNLAEGRGYIQDNPMPKVKRALGSQNAKSRSHDSIPYAQVGKALLWIRDSNSYLAKKLALRFLVLTAARTGEVLGARWSEIDWRAKTWTVPGERAKMGREHRVPLTHAALEVLREVRGWSDPLPGPSAPIFPDKKGGQIQEGGLRALLKRGYEGKAPHGFRASFKTWAVAETDYPFELSEHALAHLEGSATVRAYQRSDLFEKRRALMRDWAKYVTEAN